MGMKRLAVLAMFLALCIEGSAAQRKPVAFATASITVVDPVTVDNLVAHQQVPPVTTIGEGTVNLRRVSLGALLTRAFGVSGDQIVGPSWLKVDVLDQLHSGEARFDIHATFRADATAAQVPEMLQALLVERFRLAFHRERRDRQSLALVGGPGGPKLAKAGAASPTAGNVLRPAPGVIHIQRQRLTMSQLAGLLTAILKRPISDVTSLAGAYRVSLSFSTADPGDPVITESLEQLGLKLESRTAPADYIVIEHLERLPTPGDRR